jgi:hypothetical protein
MVIASVTLITFFSRTRWFMALKRNILDTLKIRILRRSK